MLLDARYRYHAEAARRYSRVGPRLGVQCTDALSLTVDYLVLDVDEKNRSELGLTVWYEPERPLAVDGSVRLQLIDGEPSYYTDGFVSWVAPQAGISAGAGVFVGAIGRAKDNGGDIVFLKPSPNVKEVFDLLGLTAIFRFAETREGAVGCFN